MTRLQRAGAALLVAVGFVVGQVHPHPAAAQVPMDRACRFQFDDGRDGYTTHESKHEIWCWAHRFAPHHVRRVASKGVCIARGESGLIHTADNGTHAGLFQWSKLYWPSTRAQFPVVERSTAPGIHDGRTNAAFAIAWQARRGYSPWIGNRCVS